MVTARIFVRQGAKLVTWETPFATVLATTNSAIMTLGYASCHRLSIYLLWHKPPVASTMFLLVVLFVAWLSGGLSETDYLLLQVY
jgi:hypothetical protein